MDKLSLDVLKRSLLLSKNGFGIPPISMPPPKGKAPAVKGSKSKTAGKKSLPGEHDKEHNESTRESTPERARGLESNDASPNTAKLKKAIARHHKFRDRLGLVRRVS
jgi:hypothetical protein